MVMRGSTYTAEVSFYDGPGGPLIDVGGIQLEFRLDDVSVYTAPPGEIVHDGVGKYHFDWNVPVDAEPGSYVAVWGGLVPGDSLLSYGYDNFTVTAYPAGLPGFDGCLWPVDPACLTDAWGAYDEEVRQRAVSYASATLSRLTGFRVGDCPIQVLPARQNGCCGLLGGPWLGGYMPWSELRYTDLVLGACSNPREIILPQPVYRVDEVSIGGVVVEPSDYALQRTRSGVALVYTGAARDAWPTSEDWTVTYLNTAPVDAEGAHAAGLLAMEFAKACSGTGAKCRFPSNISTIVRQGVSLEFITGAFPDGMTGIREVDNYTAKWNRRGRAPATLFDPGAPDHRVVL